MAQRGNVRFQHYLELLGFYCVALVVSCLPVQYLYVVGRVFGSIGYRVLTSRRKVALRNLQNAYPNVKLETLQKIAKGSFQSVASTFMEILWYPRFTIDLIRERVIIENPELLWNARARQKGCVFVTAHYGSWELSIHSIAIVYGGKSIAIAKSLSNPLIDTLIHKYRSAYGSKIIPMQESVRESLRTLQEGGIVCMAADQAAAKESISVEFFGRNVPTFAGPAAFCLKTRATMLVGLPVRQSDGTYRMRLHEVGYDDLHDDSEENIIELTRRHVHLTEELIREVPEQWMWMHKRWKHVPDRVEIRE